MNREVNPFDTLLDSILRFVEANSDSLAESVPSDLVSLYRQLGDFYLKREINTVDIDKFIRDYLRIRTDEPTSWAGFIGKIAVFSSLLYAEKEEP